MHSRDVTVGTTSDAGPTLKFNFISIRLRLATEREPQAGRMKARGQDERPTATTALTTMTTTKATSVVGVATVVADDHKGSRGAHRTCTKRRFSQFCCRRLPLDYGAIVDTPDELHYRQDGIGDSRNGFYSTQSYSRVALIYTDG